MKKYVIHIMVAVILVSAALPVQAGLWNWFSKHWLVRVFASKKVKSEPTVQMPVTVTKPVEQLDAQAVQVLQEQLEQLRTYFNGQDRILSKQLQEPGVNVSDIPDKLEAAFEGKQRAEAYIMALGLLEKGKAYGNTFAGIKAQVAQLEHFRLKYLVDKK